MKSCPIRGSFIVSVPYSWCASPDALLLYPKACLHLETRVNGVSHLLLKRMHN